MKIRVEEVLPGLNTHDEKVFLQGLQIGYIYGCQGWPNVTKVHGENCQCGWCDCSDDRCKRCPDRCGVTGA